LARPQVTSATFWTSSEIEALTFFGGCSTVRASSFRMTFPMLLRLCSQHGGGGDEPRTVGVRSAEGVHLFDLPVQWQSDVLTLVATGAGLTLAVDSEGRTTLAIASDT